MYLFLKQYYKNIEREAKNMEQNTQKKSISEFILSCFKLSHIYIYICKNSVFIKSAEMSLMI